MNVCFEEIKKFFSTFFQLLGPKNAENGGGILAHNLHRTREMGGVKIITGATGRGPPTMV